MSDEGTKTVRRRLGPAAVQVLNQKILSRLGETRPKGSTKEELKNFLQDYTISQIAYTCSNLEKNDRIRFSRSKRTWNLIARTKVVQVVHPDTHDVHEERDENGVLVVADATPKKGSKLARDIVATVSPTDPRVVDRLVLLIVETGSVELARSAFETAVELVRRVTS